MREQVAMDNRCSVAPIRKNGDIIYCRQVRGNYPDFLRGGYARWTDDVPSVVTWTGGVNGGN